MNERIRQLRKALNLTQQELADKLKIGRGTLANYELGRNPPIDAVIHLLCREFNVNEKWLRTGEGKMFNPEPVDILDKLAAEYGLGHRERIFVEKMLTLKPDAREAALNYLVDVVNAIITEESVEPQKATGEETEAERHERHKREARAEAEEYYREILEEKTAEDDTSAFGGYSGSGMLA